MSDSNEARKKGGRPKLQPDDLPIILAESRSRVQETVTMSAFHQRLLNRYAKWAAKKAELLGVLLSVEEAKSLVLGQGIDLVLQRDKAWGRDRKVEESLADDSPPNAAKPPLAVAGDGAQGSGPGRGERSGSSAPGPILGRNGASPALKEA
jgi:hypothetical protein